MVYHILRLYILPCLATISSFKDQLLLTTQLCVAVTSHVDEQLVSIHTTGIQLEFLVMTAVNGLSPKT